MTRSCTIILTDDPDGSASLYAFPRCRGCSPGAEQRPKQLNPLVRLSCCISRAIASEESRIRPIFDHERRLEPSLAWF